MKGYLFIIGFLTLAKLCLGQNNDMAKEVVGLINEARTDPSDFRKKYQSKIEIYNPAYAKKLLNEKPIEPIVWDEGLEAMAKSVVEEKNLNPTYAGENKLCGNASGNSSGDISTDPLKYVCDIHTNIHDNSYKYIGLYFNQSNTGYSFQLGISCEREKIEFEFTETIDTSGVNFKSLNTGAKADYMSELEKRMLLEINFVRAYPQIYAKIIAQYLATKSASWAGLDKGTYDAGMELIEELNEMAPFSILTPSECLYNVVTMHGLDCQKRGFFSHTGSDNSQPWDRITKQCPDLKWGNENGAGNGSFNPRIPVIQLLLDDGISGRGHRYNILNKDWQYGVCFRYVDVKYGYHWVQNFGY